MNKQILLILFLILILLTRIQSSGGLFKPMSQDPLLESYAEKFTPYRQFLSSKINEVLPQPQSALLSGILLGEKSDLSKDFKKALTNTSTIHIIVVSGQNLTLLIGVLMSFVTFLGRKKTITLSLIVVVIYSLLTGLQIPVLRAAIMVSIALIAQYFHRESDSTWLLILTALLMLIYQPDWLLSISFQLSFLATLAVITLAPVLIKQLNFIPEILRENLGVSISAQLLTWPVIALNFHQFSVVGILVNTLVLWTISFIMISGIIALLGTLISIDIGFVLSLIPATLLTYFVYIVNFFNSIPISSLYIGNIPTTIWLGYYLIILALFLYLKKITPQTEAEKALKNQQFYQKGG